MFENGVPPGFNPGFGHPLYIIRRGLLQKIKEYSPHIKGKVLDFGCGAKPYKSLFTGASEYTGVDYDGGGHSHENEAIDFFYDGRTLPFENETFDSVFSSEVFEHIFNLEEILPEICRVMKPAGKILITCPFVWNEHEVPFDYARYTRFALDAILKKSGFRIISADKSGDFISTIHQMKMLYFSEVIINKKLKMLLLKKIARQVLVPLLNRWLAFKRKFYSSDNSLYLNNIILAEKI